MTAPGDEPGSIDGVERLLRPEDLSSRERYRLLTTLVVPRPIGWISTRSRDGVPNLAPYSFFAALSANPLLVAASIGRRQGRPKDTLENIRQTGCFSVNVVSLELLEAMNASSAEVPPETDEFQLAGVTACPGKLVDVPCVQEAPAVLECRLFKEVELGDAPNTLVIGEVKCVRLAAELKLHPGTLSVDQESLRPVGRLGGAEYALPGEIRELPRPR